MKNTGKITKLGPFYKIIPKFTTCRVAWREHHTPTMLVPRAEGEASGVRVSVFESSKMNTIVLTIPSHHSSLSSRFYPTHSFSFGVPTKINHLSQFKICVHFHSSFHCAHLHLLLFFLSNFGFLNNTS